MKTKIVSILCFCAPLTFPQVKSITAQQAGDCSVNVLGSNDTASLVCNGLDPKIANQVRAIVNGTRHNERATKEISEKLDLILKQLHKETIPPEIALSFIYPKSPALLLHNQSAAIARDIKYAFALWNMDLPDRNGPLPIPAATFDWIRPNDRGGPLSFVDSPTVASLLKPGDRLFGTTSVICPTCSRGRTYIVYIVWGQGGWYSDMSDDKSGQLRIPANLTKEGREQYFAWLEAAVPAELRMPIE